MKKITIETVQLFESVYKIPCNIIWSDAQHSYIGLDDNTSWWLFQDKLEAFSAGLDAAISTNQPNSAP